MTLKIGNLKMDKNAKNLKKKVIRFFVLLFSFEESNNKSNKQSKTAQTIAMDSAELQRKRQKTTIMYMYTV